MNTFNFVIISSEFPPGPGGIGRHAYSLSMALHKQGYQLVVLTESDYATHAELDRFDLKHHAFFQITRTPRKGILTYILRVINTIKLIQQQHPSVIIVSGKFSLWIGMFIKLIKRKNIKVWAFLHGSEIQLPQKWEKKLTLFSLSTLDRLLAVSSFSKALLPPSLQTTTEIIPNGLLLDEMPSDMGSDIEGYDWPGWPRLLTVGSVTPRKGQHRVIKALPHLITLWPDIRYHIVGLPKYQEAFYQLAEELGVAHCVVFHGRVPDSESLWKCYKSADAFIMLSENQADGDVEGFGIAILEANYFGLPSIGAKGCGIEDAIDEGTNGFLVDGDDPAAIAYALEKTMQNRHSLSQTSMSYAQAHDWPNLIRQLLQH